MELRVKKLKENAIIPTTGTEHSIGYDLYSCEEYVIQPHQKICVETGIAIEIYSDDTFCTSYKSIFSQSSQGPRDTVYLDESMFRTYYGRIAPRSSLALKDIDTLAGVIDADYRGEIKVLLINHGDHPCFIKNGDKIAQLIIECAYKIPVVEVADVSNTLRGAGGFGSTNK